MGIQTERLLKYLKRHKKGITALEAWNELSIMRLSARIIDLRRKGHHILTVWEDGVNLYGDLAVMPVIS